jgi:hypothetical protein
VKRAALALALAACGIRGGPTPGKAPAAIDAAPDVRLPDSTVTDQDAPPDAAPPLAYLRGSTHVHARPSGDADAPLADVIRWYEDHGYDFIVLTDHNRVSPVDAPTRSLIVIPGVELTHNSNDCLGPPPPVAEPKCRTHINAIGVREHPDGKLAWDAHATRERLGTYTLALDEAKALGGLAQLNHPQWHWGMTAELLVALASRGARLYEVWNRQFPTWNAGDAEHPSTEALWDAALTQGATLWGVASDDAHDYTGTGTYPAGGAYVMVHAARRADAILAALAIGDFYASTGVTLDRAGVDGGALVVDVSRSDPGDHAIAFIGEGGTILREVPGSTARFPLADLGGRGYVRAVVTRSDGAKAWIQPVRAPAP